MQENSNRKKPGIYHVSVIVCILVIVVLNTAALSHSFCDFYTDNIFGVITMPYTLLTGLFPFSVGEILIPVAAVVVIAALVMGLLYIFIKKERYRKFAGVFVKSTVMLVLIVGLVMTLNCSIPYNCSKLSVNGNDDKEYTIEQIKILRNYIVNKCLELSEQMDRDEEGYVIYGEDIDAKVKKSLKGLSADYKRLSGYYPDAKSMFGSYFMYQSQMSGVYFPFTMEANYNSYISATAQPFTIAHELSHLKGYMFENEANFFAFLACINSDDDLVRYSGYVNVMGYIDDDFLEYVDWEDYEKEVEITDMVWRDYYTYTDKVYEELVENEDNALISTETVNELSSDFSESYLDYYNVQANYNEVTKYLLQYYDGILY